VKAIDDRRAKQWSQRYNATRGPAAQRMAGGADGVAPASAAADVASDAATSAFVYGTKN